MTTTYNNIPSTSVTSSVDTTVKFFDNYYKVPIELSGTSLAAITGFFESKGYGKSAAESVAVIILSQAKKDNLNPFEIIDTLKGISSLQLSALVGEILNFNRFKSSSLGITKTPNPADEIQRNIFL